MGIMQIKMVIIANKTGLLGLQCEKDFFGYLSNKCIHKHEILI